MGGNLATGILLQILGYFFLARLCVCVCVCAICNGKDMAEKWKFAVRRFPVISKCMNELQEVFEERSHNQVIFQRKSLRRTNKGLLIRMWPVKR